ncbi:SDR family oxidoreductase, partial [Candidatus Bipolaricaulota bacterium]|nr:SDR family oxidoreductase [Candidatus Bipolaricaulota bacterium]
MGTKTQYLVTGGAGFIGSHLVQALVESGQTVRVLDNLSTGKRENLSGLDDKLEFIEGDMTDFRSVEQAMQGISVVFHQAALPSVPRSIEDPLGSHHANATGTLNVLTAAKAAGVRRVIYASSSSAYGDTPVLPKVETMAPMPLSPYAVSKLAGEYYCQVFSHVYNLETVALRYFNVFGPKQDPHSQYSAVIPKFIGMYLRGQSPTIDGDGEQTRGFAYVDNVVQANLLAAKAQGVSGNVFNISVDTRISLNTLDAKLREYVGVSDSVKPTYGPSRAGDIKHSYADISKAITLLG